ncbi:glycoside hydrolase family 127 protein [Jiangella endophytica]|uniref:glycoside hydrolase family 127 protein n=1 Tax=Jiangella endophytica TaxID=1623398 RepID=UPI000E357CB7|nr:beta-L-arabinofuranosidase domain-containing protein [Jiangella endophytica]
MPDASHPQRGLPVAPSRGRLTPVPAGDVVLEDGFWQARQDLNASTVLPHALDWIDRLGWTDAFRRAAAGEDARPRQGKLFTDADVYKTAEALAWEASRTPSGPAGERLADLGALIRSAQEPDGYLNTWFGHRHAAEKYTNLSHGFELYCYGHLIQAGVARLRGGAEDDLTAAALAAADHAVATFGGDGDTRIDGHPEIEAALVELARVTGQERYLDLAGRFLARRGHDTLEHHAIGPEYYLDDSPLRDVDVLRGHAVRALYLTAGALDHAVETGDDALVEHLVAQWDRTVATRTYLHGGMGSRHLGESFGHDYELPTERAYAETCGAIAGVMAAWRFTLATGEPRFADYAERALFNMVATALHPSGRRFLYVNPLHVRHPLPEPGDDEAPFRKDTPRAPWFWVSCCPTNLARLFASFAGYVATTDAGGLQLHQLTAARIATDVAGQRVVVRVHTSYPWDGSVEIEIVEADGRDWELAVRVPGWARSARIEVAGDVRVVVPGTARARRNWRPGDRLTLRLDTTPRLSVPDPRIDAVRGTVAVERGPLVYCAEVPGGAAEARHTLPESRPKLTEVPAGVDGLDPDAVGVATTVRTTTEAAMPAWPYGAAAPEAETTEHELTLVPLYLWGLRGPSTMRVFLPVEGTQR